MKCSECKFNHHRENGFANQCWCCREVEVVERNGDIPACQYGELKGDNNG